MSRKKSEYIDESTPIDKQYEALDKAKKAAETGDVLSMVSGLFESYALDGLISKLRKNHPELDDDDIDAVIAEAVENTREYVKKGNKIRYLLGFLWRVAERRCIDLLRTRPPESVFMRSSYEEMEGYTAKAEDDESIRKKSRNDAFKLARSMLPDLGGKNIQLVMEYQIELIEKDIEMTSEEIGDALTLSAETVRQSRKRGLERLKRLFIERGFAVDAFDVHENDD